tara:strand:- start:923 stop:2782 length:1860 start_codon:yes stop_codon:yes gene_type:complete
MRNFGLLFFFLLFIYSEAQITTQAELNENNTAPINPMLYGYNQDHSEPGAQENWGSRRLGGNRLSVFNWENGASNSGADNTQLTNDNRVPSLVGTTWNERNNTGEAYRKFHQDNLDANITSILTVPILGSVAADKNGSNLTTPPSNRWHYAIAKKSTPLSTIPNLSDDSVFIDESVYWLTQQFGNATSANGVKYISLDNEPGLWSHTHASLEQSATLAADYVQKVIKTAIAIKEVDPNIKLIAGEFAGINKFDFKNAPDWGTVGVGYDWFISYFLDELKKASIMEGYNLIDFISFHFYPQDKIDVNGNFSSSGIKALSSNSEADYMHTARMQFTRSLWDTTYIEPSWLTGSKLNNEPHKALIRFQKSIDEYFPSVEIMIGEWDLGNDKHVSHGIATVDALGAMGQYKVAIANRWDLQIASFNTYTTPAFKLFRNFNGSYGTYGDVMIESSFDQHESSSVWASKNSNNDELHLIIVNKDLTQANNFKVKLNSANYNLSITEVWGFDGYSTSIVEPANNAIVTNDSLNITLPPTAAYHVVIQRNIITNLNNQLDSKQPVLKIFGKNKYEIKYPINKAQWTLFDAKGKAVLNNKDGIIDLNNMKKGVYFIKTQEYSFKIIRN